MVQALGLCPQSLSLLDSSRLKQDDLMPERLQESHVTDLTIQVSFCVYHTVAVYEKCRCHATLPVM